MWQCEFPGCELPPVVNTTGYEGDIAIRTPQPFCAEHKAFMEQQAILFRAEMALAIAREEMRRDKANGVPPPKHWL